MAAIYPKLEDVAVGSTLRSWEALKAAIEDHSITKKIAFLCRPKDQTRANYVCRQKDEGCPFRVYASLNLEGDIEIKKLCTEHLCAGAPESTRTTANTQSWLQRIVPELLYPQNLQHCRVCQQCSTSWKRVIHH